MSRAPGIAPYHGHRLPPAHVLRDPRMLEEHLTLAGASGRNWGLGGRVPDVVLDVIQRLTDGGATYKEVADAFAGAAAIYAARNPGLPPMGGRWEPTVNAVHGARFARARRARKRQLRAAMARSTSRSSTGAA